MITNEQKLKFQQMTLSQLNNELIPACYNGDFDSIKYLLSSSELEEHADIHLVDDIAIRCVCSQGYLDIVKFLLSSPDLIEHADIHASDNNSLITSCTHGHLEIVQYLLTSPELHTHANIHANNDSSFINACAENYLDIIEYLIFDYKIVKTMEIEEYLISYNRKDIRNMFEKRQIEKKLQNELTDNHSITITKVKL